MDPLNPSESATLSVRKVEIIGGSISKVTTKVYNARLAQ